MTETSTEPSPIILEDEDKGVLHEQEGEVKYRLGKEIYYLPS